MEWLTSQLQATLDAVEAAFAWVVGATGGRSSYVLARWVFLRVLGVVYLIAFTSLWVQIKGLVGPRGILPAQPFLDAAGRYFGADRFHAFPTVFWINGGGTALDVVCAAGVLCSALLIANVWPVGALAVLWVLYLSLTTIGREFLAFQWDVLLLEAGLLAVLLAPGHLLPGRRAEGAVAALALFLLWWLLFRLTFQSGLVKLTTGDPTWRNLTALDYHYFTQPLPTWTAWYVHQLPGWFKKLSVVAMYVMELLLPLLIFAPRPARLVGCAGMILLQLLILSTGNYNFFNLLTIALCLLLVDDAIWARILPAGLTQRVTAGDVPMRSLAAGVTVAVVGAGLLLVSCLKFWLTAFPRTSLPWPVARPVAWLEPFRSVNSYGLFRVMTTARPEIVVEGSDDDATWQAYEFRYKPGDVRRPPGFVEPHQPRLDWQMWFAALSTFEQERWLRAFLTRLLEGSPDVARLLATNPFPDRPPRYVRALLYDYRFTTWEERRTTGAWWTRRELGAYSPVLALR